MSMEAEWRRTTRACRRWWWWWHLQEHGWSNGTTPRCLHVNHRHCFPGCGVCTCSPSGSQCHRQYDIAEGLYQNRVHAPPRVRESCQTSDDSVTAATFAYCLCFLFVVLLSDNDAFVMPDVRLFLDKCQGTNSELNWRQQIWIND